ncbi:MAG: hypothetical protein KDE45_06730, partial [Caldilineaceae bacterium]|nr:hypothetical protein [Caldilineaceae bacterium]
MNARRTVLVGLCLFILLQILGGTAPISADSPMPESKAPRRGTDSAIFMPLVFRDAASVDNTARWLTDDLTQ